jgi:hypothetical protein
MREGREREMERKGEREKREEKGGVRDVPPEKHNSTRIINLVHGVEVWDGSVVDGVYDGEVFDEWGGFVEVFVLLGTLVSVVSSGEHNEHR